MSGSQNVFDTKRMICIGNKSLDKISHRASHTTLFLWTLVPFKTDSSTFAAIGTIFEPCWLKFSSNILVVNIWTSLSCDLSKQTLTSSFSTNPQWSVSNMKAFSVANRPAEDSPLHSGPLWTSIPRPLFNPFSFSLAVTHYSGQDPSCQSLQLSLLAVFKAYSLSLPSDSDKYDNHLRNIPSLLGSNHRSVIVGANILHVRNGVYSDSITSLSLLESKSSIPGANLP